MASCQEGQARAELGSPSAAKSVRAAMKSDHHFIFGLAIVSYCSRYFGSRIESIRRVPRWRFGLVWVASLALRASVGYLACASG